MNFWSLNNAFNKIKIGPGFELSTNFASSSNLDVLMNNFRH